MKGFAKIAAGGLVLVMTLGCSRPFLRATGIDRLDPENFGTLVVRNNLASGDSLSSVSLYVDGWQVGRLPLKGGEEITMRLIPGDHLVAVRVGSTTVPLGYSIEQAEKTATVAIKKGQSQVLSLGYGGLHVRVGKTILMDTLGLLILAPVWSGFVQLERHMDLGAAP